MTSSLLHNSPSSSSFFKKSKQTQQSSLIKDSKDNNSYIKPNMSASSARSKGRPGGGWEDVETDFSPSHSHSMSSLNEDNSHETKIIDDVIQPGGVRLRQSEVVLEGFFKACESLEIDVIGSILLSKLTSGIPWVSKTRAIFAIEILCKKSENYLAYFKRNITHLKQIPLNKNWQNTPQLNTAFEGLLKLLQGQTSSNIFCDKENQNSVNKTLQFKAPSEKKPLATFVNNQKQSLKEVSMQETKPQVQSTAINTSKQRTSSMNSSQETSGSETNPVFTQSKPIGPPKGVAVSLPDLSMSKDEITYPGEQAFSLIASLSDLDFTGSPAQKNNDIYQLYKSTESLMASEEIAMNLQLSQHQGYYPYSYNQQGQGNFSNNNNNYYGLSQSHYGYNGNNEAMMLSNNNDTQQPDSDQFEDFDGPSKVLKEGYVDPEEIQKMKEREAIEKKFEALRF